MKHILYTGNKQVVYMLVFGFMPENGANVWYSICKLCMNHASSHVHILRTRVGVYTHLKKDVQNI